VPQQDSSLVEDFIRRRNNIRMDDLIEEGYDEDVEQSIMIEQSVNEEEKNDGSNNRR
jgi:hypothetical protein